jgi:hypothetical protein
VTEFEQVLREVSESFSRLASQWSFIDSDFVGKLGLVAYVDVIEISAQILNLGPVFFLDEFNELGLCDLLSEELGNQLSRDPAEHLVLHLGG